jgi:hypothetical protein
MNSRKWLSGISVSAQVAFAVGCGAGNMTTPVMQTQSGTVFVSGSDAPLPGIVSFKAIISGTSVAERSKTPVTATTGPQTVDFARLNGLHALMDLNTIPARTYHTVIVALASPEIAYRNVTNPQTTPPTRPTISSLTSTTTPPATLSTSTVKLSLSSPLVVNAGDVIALGFEFDIRKSLAVDMNGQITGVINPTLDLKAIAPSDADAFIDEFVAGLTTINVSLTHARNYASKIKLEQVRPDSAFWSSEMSSGVTWKPRVSMCASVRGKDAGKMTVFPKARALAACGSQASTSIQS